MLLYALLYLTGYQDVTLDQLKRFRQWGSKTPGHPENILTPGVEMATGPLGQGFATGVGMAIAEEKLRHDFPELVDHHTYAICSDGDLMEGVSHEAASLAGHGGDPNYVTTYSGHFAIVLDNVVRSTPYIDYLKNPDGIDSSTAQIDMGQGGTMSDAKDLALVLQTRALPVNFQQIERTHVSAT